MLRIFYGILFLGAGVMHFVNERAFMSIIPKAWPFKRFMVQVSGVIEIVYGTLLLLNRGTRFVKRTGPAFLLAVFPANINMALKPSRIGGKTIPNWVTWLRLPLQWVLIKGIKKI
ncbi:MULTISPECIES: DoxX family protein [Exiguobacterium]|uniref:DoxX family membrane protein n=1 Tax=Exiguobacterium alkaliphilum TaxID=1428684 RepID=A0ABT2L003_9BACL|nr:MULTISPECIES: DoxX family membrane protein [Exiguobacterium]MCT4795205.1 DoxX family membrane protein [Exiguobacterium alkaliphilum]QUE85501.1 DoxX family membrane protein [Exiguobacterium alkaliphilum]